MLPEYAAVVPPSLMVMVGAVISLSKDAMVKVRSDAWVPSGMMMVVSSTLTVSITYATGPVTSILASRAALVAVTSFATSISFSLSGVAKIGSTTTLKVADAVKRLPEMLVR